MSNEAALIVILAIWLMSGRGVNLCLLILLYYAAYLLTSVAGIHSIVVTDHVTVFATYAIQTSLDSMMITAIICMLLCGKQSIQILLAYGAIITTSLLLNGAMLYEQMLDISIIYKLHAIRQEFSIPLDVLFAVLGSAAGGRYFDRGLPPTHVAGYNRANRSN